jgi:hypothetical protein
VIRPQKTDRPYQFRVVDEEGEDYLYPREWFAPVQLQARQRRQLASALAT